METGAIRATKDIPAGDRGQFDQQNTAQERAKQE